MQPVKLNAIIYQGATFRLDLDRVFYPYPVIARDGVVTKEDGSPAPDSDRVAESYVGCEARMQIRESVGAPTVIATLDTTDGGIVLGANRLSIYISDADTSGMSGWQTAIGHVEVVRASGDVERQYEITFTLNPEVTL